MAVIDSFPGLKVEIIVNESAITEYAGDGENEEDKPNTITKFVEATTGAEFRIRCEFAPSFKFKKYAIRADAYIDGIYVDKWNKACEKTLMVMRGPHSCLHEGIWQKQRFAFSSLQIGDEGPRAIDEAIHRKLADLGTIRIRMWRVQVIDSHVRRSSKIVPSMSQTEFSEKAVKGRAISHCVRLQNAQESTAGNCVTTIKIDPLHSPFVVFNFKYRSLKALKDLRLVSRSPSPIPIEDRPVEELNIEQLREIARKAQVHRTTLPIKTKRELKEEPEDDDDEEVSFVEQRPCKVARISTGPVETIDLT